MIFSIITISIQAIALFIIGYILTFIISKILRISRKGNIFKFFIALLIINSISYFTKITIPEQNSFITILIVSLFYLFLFFILPKFRKGIKKIGKIKLPFIFIIFILVLMLVGKGEFLDTGTTSLSKKISVGNNLEIIYNSKGGINPNIGFFNNYGNSIYDTVKYDINTDRFVDIKYIDNNDDGIVDNMIVNTYNTQKILLFILLLISIIFIYTYTKKGNNKELAKKNKPGLFKLNLSALNILKKGNNKIVSLILILILLSNISGVLALTNTEIKKQSEIYQVKSKMCAQDPFNDKKCRGIDKNSRLILQHMQNPQFIKESNSLIKKQQNCSNKCNKAQIQKLRLEYQQWQKKWLNIKPINYGTKPNIGSTPPNNKLIPNINTGSEPLNNIIKNLDESYDLPDLNGVTGKIIDGIDKIKKIIDKNSTKPNNKYKSDKLLVELKNYWNETETKNILGDISKFGKASTDYIGKSLEVINNGAIFGLKKELKSIGLGNKPNIDKINKIEKKIEKLIGKGGDNLTDITNGLAKKLDGLKSNNISKYDEVMNGLGKTTKKLKKYVDGLGYLGSVFDVYMDSQSFYKKFNGDKTKTFIATAITYSVKKAVGSNPIDIAMGLISGGLALAGFEKASKTVDGYSIGTRTKELLEDSYDETSIEQIIDQRASDFLEIYNDPNASTLYKISDFLQLNVTIGYGAVVGITGVGLGAIGSFIGMFKK